MDLAVQTCLIGRQPLLVQGSAEAVYSDLDRICSHLNLARKSIDYHHDAEVPTSLSEEERSTALVIVALNLHIVSRNAQIQALELLRVPKTGHFLFIAVLPIGLKAKDHITTHVVS